MIIINVCVCEGVGVCRGYVIVCVCLCLFIGVIKHATCGKHTSKDKNRNRNCDPVPAQMENSS